MKINLTSIFIFFATTFLVIILGMILEDKFRTSDPYNGSIVAIFILICILIGLVVSSTYLILNKKD